tara:strand:+ start:87 stop:623 length:537 start_codon:yes stop_codon:yes gene_type:complete
LCTTEQNQYLLIGYMKYFLTLSAILLSFGMFSQSDEDFNNYGVILFRQMTDSTQTEFVDFIRTREYHEIIDRQPMNENQKSLAKHKINESYNKMYVDYQRSIQELVENYSFEILDGATFEYLETRYEALDGSKDTYAMKTNFIYRNKKVQTQVSFVFDVAWLDKERGFVLISPIKEDF